MKVYSIIFAGLLLALGAKAQEKIMNHIATVQLPKGSQNIAMTEFQQYGKRNFKRIVTPANNSHSFIVDNSLMVSIRELSVAPENRRSLEKWKRQLESVFQQSESPWDVSKIDTVNGNRFYVFEDHKGDEYNTSFYSEDIGDKKLSGFISFKAKDKEKAHQYLYNLLKDVKLKK